MPVYSYTLRSGLRSELPGNPPLSQNELAFTSDTKELWIGQNGSAITPNFYDGDLNTTTNNGRPATTRWVQQLLSTISSTPPSGIAWRTQDNTFTGNNIFQEIPSITDNILPVGDNSNRIPTTAWVQQELTSLNGLAFINRDNIFGSNNVFNAITTFNGNISSLGTVNFSSSTWVKAPLESQANTPTNNVATTQYIWESHSYDQKIKKTATPSLNWNNSNSSKEIPTLEWLHQNLPSASLLTSNNSWTGLNTYNLSPLINNQPSLTDNSNKVPTTNWVRSIIDNSLSGGRPVLTKSLIEEEYNKLLWSDGIVNISGTNYSVSKGDFTFLDSNAPGVYYIKAQLIGGIVTISIPSMSNTISANEVLLGNLTLVDVSTTSPIGDPDRSITSIINRTSNFAERDRVNTFSDENTFFDTVSFLYPSSGVSNSYLVINSDNLDVGLPSNFRGIAKGFYSIPAISNDETLATTQWVKDNFAGGTTPDSFFELNSNGELVLKSPTNTINLLNKNLKVKSPISGNDAVNKSWVESLLSTSPTIPIVNLIAGTMQFSWGAGEIVKPDGSICNIAAGGPSFLSTGTQYIYVRYSDCAVIPSSTFVNETTEGKNIATVSINGSTIIIEPIFIGKWATIDSPNFIGIPTAPLASLDVCDDQIATTDWVCQKLENLLTKPCNDSFSLPTVYNVDGPSLLVNVTNGVVPFDTNNLEGPKCNVRTLKDPIALVGLDTEYVWCRYADCAIVASKSAPSASIGRLLATITTGADSIINIQNVSGEGTETFITRNYGVTYGGYLSYIGPVEC